MLHIQEHEQTNSISIPRKQLHSSIKQMTLSVKQGWFHKIVVDFMDCTSSTNHVPCAQAEHTICHAPATDWVQRVVSTDL